MNTTPEDSTTQSDDTQGHALTSNVNEMVDSDDDDTQGHGLSANVNEMVDSDDDTQGHGLAQNVNETVDSDDAELKRPDEAVEDLEPDMHEADEVTGGVTLNFQKVDP